MGQAANQVRRAMSKTEKRLDAMVRMATLELANHVTLESPVDTGRFRGNWQFGTTPPLTELQGPFNENMPPPDLSGPVAGFEAGQTGYLLNNVPYARTLEYGHSDQAPLGVVRVAVKMWPTFVNSAALAAKALHP